MKKHASIFFPVLIWAVVAVLFTSCSEKKFHISGKISQAKDSVLYFENMALDGPQAVDSVKLDEEGAFSFEGLAPDAPEFYRLRIAGQIINLSVDSTETITVDARYPSMSVQYAVSGSRNCEVIRELSQKQIALQEYARSVFENPGIGLQTAEDSILRLIDAYKRDISRNYIFKEPMKAYAYFALFQYIAVGNEAWMIFDPRRDGKDVKVFAAVATSWDAFYPGSLRGKNLHNIALEGMREKRIMENRGKEWVLDADQVGEAGLIDVALNDNNGRTQRLSQLAGKVVLLDFHLFSMKGSTERIMMLRELYDKYRSKGLEIYQVSLDADEHFWKTQTASLPWINVHDDGTRTQAYLSVAPQIPCSYIIGRDNSVVKGPREIKDLDADIASQL